MIWRSIRSSHFLPATCPGNLFIPPCRRWLSNKSSPSAYQNIATILDFRPSTEQQESQPIVVTGHVRTVRNQKARSFVEIGDGSSIHSLQAIVAPWQAVGYDFDRRIQAVKQGKKLMGDRFKARDRNCSQDIRAVALVASRQRAVLRTSC